MVLTSLSAHSVHITALFIVAWTPKDFMNNLWVHKVIYTINLYRPKICTFNLLKTYIPILNESKSQVAKLDLKHSVLVNKIVVDYVFVVILSI